MKEKLGDLTTISQRGLNFEKGVMVPGKKGNEGVLMSLLVEEETRIPLSSSVHRKG